MYNKHTNFAMEKKLQQAHQLCHGKKMYNKHTNFAMEKMYNKHTNFAMEKKCTTSTPPFSTRTRLRFHLLHLELQSRSFLYAVRYFPDKHNFY